QPERHALGGHVRAHHDAVGRPAHHAVRGEVRVLTPGGSEDPPLHTTPVRAGLQTGPPLPYSPRPTVFPSANFAPTNAPAGAPLIIGRSRIVTAAPAGNVDGRIPCRPS